MIFTDFQRQLRNSIADFLQSGDSSFVVKVLDSQEKQHYENDIKVLIDTIFRETLLKLSCEPEINIQKLEWLLQLAISFARSENCSVNLPTIILGELFDCRTLQDCELLFSFIDSNVQTWKEEFFFKNVKNHLLRICNDLLRRLSRNQNTVFCGRILIFLANFFPLFERSGLNLTSEFNQDNSTTYALQADSELSDGTAAAKKADREETDSKVDPVANKVDMNFYKKFWQLQEYFRNPTICYTRNNFKTFQQHCGDVLSVFAGNKIDSNSGFYFQTLGLDCADDKDIFFVKYLTNQKLLELQLSDSNFRRHILIQMLILFQYFTLNVKFRADGATLNEEQNNWISETRKKVHQLIEETPPNGEEVRKVLEHLLKREEYWNNWKNEGCKEELKECGDSEEVEQETADYIRSTYLPSAKRARIGDNIRQITSNGKMVIGNNDMTRLWNFCPDNLAACKSQQRIFTPTIENYFEPLMKTTPEEREIYCEDSNYCWKALRLLSQKSNHFFVPSNQVVKYVKDYLVGVTDRLAQDLNSPLVTPEADGEMKDSKNDEAKTETEDISDDELLKNVETSSVKSNEEDTPEGPDTNDSNTNESGPPGPDNVINDALIEQAALKIQDHWETVSPLFGFQADELQYIKESHSNANARMKYLITIWKEENGVEVATLKNLQKILHNAKLDINLY